MTRENQDGWKTEVRQKREDSELNGFTGSLGTLSSPGPKIWNNPLRVGGANSEESNTSTINTGAGNAGGIARQLIEETRKQLAYHKAQVSELEVRLHELETFTEVLETEDT